MKMIVDLALFLSDLLFILSFIYIAINHITSLKQTHVVCRFLRISNKESKKVSKSKISVSGCCLTLLDFCQFQPRSVAYTKRSMFLAEAAVVTRIS